MFQSSGILKYTKNVNYSLRVVIDSELTRYYRSLLPKWMKSKQQMYSPHISVVRKESPIYLEFWGKYEGELITFDYDHEIEYNDTYVWLNAYSHRLEQIRVELGLPIHSQYTMPPEGFTKRFHTTIGNFKDL